MIRRLILSRLAAAEQDVGVPMDYLRHIAGVSLRALFKFLKLMPLARYRRVLAPEPYHVARIVATQHEDCGTCVQIAVHLARRDGLAADQIRAVLAGRLDELPEELVDVYRFTGSVVANSAGQDDLRERIRRHYGEEGLVELALAIAACKVFPITKRALGYATSCSLVKVRV